MKSGILAAGVLVGLSMAFSAKAQDLSVDDYLSYISNNKQDVLNRIGGKEGVIAGLIESDDYKNSVCYDPDAPAAQVTADDLISLNEDRRKGKDLRVMFHTIHVSKDETFYCIQGADYAVKIVPGM